MLIVITLLLLFSILLNFACYAALFNQIKIAQLQIAEIKVHTTKNVTSTASLASYIVSLLDSLKKVVNSGQVEVLNSLPKDSTLN